MKLTKRFLKKLILEELAGVQSERFNVDDESGEVTGGIPGSDLHAPDPKRLPQALRILHKELGDKLMNKSLGMDAEVGQDILELLQDFVRNHTPGKSAGQIGNIE